jgi:arylsulfatase A-like enzyme
MATYYQQIHAIDVAVGMIRDALKEAGVAENTVVIYTSDNGFMCGSHGYGSKVLPYEESSCVPLIIYDPRNPNSGKQLRCDALTCNIDIAPTVMSLAQVPIPTDVDGKNLMSLYNDTEGQGHEHIALVNVWGPRALFSLSVVTPKWKYVRWPYSERQFKPTDELYDMVKDRLELRNLASSKEHTGPLSQMRSRYDQYVAMWKREAVAYNNYAELGDFFER